MQDESPLAGKKVIDVVFNGQTLPVSLGLGTDTPALLSIGFSAE